MSVPELKILEKWAQHIQPEGIIVEIGSFMGRTSWTLAHSCHPSVHIYCIDPWPLYRISTTMKHVMDDYNDTTSFCFDTFLQNTQDCPNLTPLRGYSTQVSWPKTKKIDLVFIDAKHQSPHVEQDIACWLPRLKPEGILAGHDYIPERYPDVCCAVQHISHHLSKPIEFFEGSLWKIQL